MSKSCENEHLCSDYETTTTSWANAHSWRRNYFIVVNVMIFISGLSLRISERKTYHAAFCASLALLAGSGNNAGCRLQQWWKEWRTDNYVCEDLVRLIYLYLGKSDFFFGIALLSLLQPAVRVSRLYIFSGLLINMQYLKRAGLWKNLVVAPMVRKPSILMLKNWFPTRKLHQLFIGDEKMSLLTGKNWESTFSSWLFFFLPERRNPAIFFKLGTWRAAKLEHAYYVPRVERYNVTPNSPKRRTINPVLGEELGKNY